MISPEIQQLCEDLRSEIGHAKELSTTTDIHSVFMSVETIIGIMAYLISPLVVMESKFNTLVKQLESEGKSHASAETVAKTSEEYAEWKKVRLLYELGNEQVKVLKKFTQRLGEEYQR